VAASSQAALAANRTEGRWASPGVRLQVADGQLANGVAAVVGVQLNSRADAVGDKGVIAPGGKQLGLVALVTDATHDQPVALVGSLGDLGQPVALVGDRDPGCLGDGSDRGVHGLGLANLDRVADPVAAEPLDELGRPDPESARKVSSPLAPARRSRAISSSTNRRGPRAVLAEPLRSRACSTSPLSARVASSGW
jgi:hypothetical protein